MRQNINAYLVCSNKPFDRSLPEDGIAIRYFSLHLRNLPQMSIQCVLLELRGRVISLLFPRFDCFRKLGFKLILLRPLVVLCLSNSI